MFRRIIHEHWHDLVPVIAFILTFAVFIVAFIRALLARKEMVAHMAALPLDEPLLVPATELPLEKQDEGAGCSDTCRRCPGCRRKEGGHSHESAHSHAPSHQHTPTH
jgi:hypothetical protein